MSKRVGDSISSSLFCCKNGAHKSKMTTKSQKITKYLTKIHFFNGLFSQYFIILQPVLKESFPNREI